MAGTCRHGCHRRNRDHRLTAHHDKGADDRVVVLRNVTLVPAHTGRSDLAGVAGPYSLAFRFISSLRAGVRGEMKDQGGCADASVTKPPFLDRLAVGSIVLGR